MLKALIFLAVGLSLLVGTPLLLVWGAARSWPVWVFPAAQLLIALGLALALTGCVNLVIIGYRLFQREKRLNR